jgi:HD-like signal output (HDOD) protein
LLCLDHNALVQCAQKLPLLPQGAARLAHLVAQAEPDLSAIVEVIERDPMMTIKLLRVANSVLGSSRYVIGTVREAVIRLGTGTVSGFAIGACVRPVMSRTIPGYNLSGTDFWTHSLAVAFASDALRQFARPATSPLAFTAGLLHDFGKLVLGSFLRPEVLAWLDRAMAEGKQAPFQAEAQILSLHHGEVGGVIAQHWGLPNSIVQGIIYHHDPDASPENICWVTYLANSIAHGLTPGTEGEGSAPPADLEQALERLGLSQDNFVKVGPIVRAQLKAVSGQYA